MAVLKVGSAVAAPPLVAIQQRVRRRAARHGAVGLAGRADRRGAELARQTENGVRLAQQKMQVGYCVPVGIQLQKAGVGPTSGPTWRLSHFEHSLAVRDGEAAVDLAVDAAALPIGGLAEISVVVPEAAGWPEVWVVGRPRRGAGQEELAAGIDGGFDVDDAGGEHRHLPRHPLKSPRDGTPLRC